MHNRVLAALSALFFLAVLQAGQPAQAEDPPGGTGGGPIAGHLLVRVIEQDTGQPSQGAFVMVGPAPGVPFEGNHGFTSASGEIVFTDPGLTGPVTVTAGAHGYAYFTIVSVDANDLVLPLTPIADDSETFQVGDYVSGIDVNNGSFNMGDGFIDMALVVPCLKLSDFLSFDLESIIGPPEIIEILGEPFEVPSNIFLPSQYELFIHIIKDWYYLYLPQGDYTLAAISGRVPRDDLLSAGDIVDVIPLTQWRRIDAIDITVMGDMYDADLFVNPALAQTVTLNMGNIPENTVTWCFSVGDLDGLTGLGRLAPLGFNSFDCPPGSGTCSGPVQMTTTAATGEFAGMSYLSGVAVEFREGNDVLVLLQRGPYPQHYTVDMDSFYLPLDLAYDSGLFTWNDVENPPTATPPVHVQTARILSMEGNEVYWEFMIPGSVHAITVPELPAGAPPGPDPGDTCQWEHMVAGLGYDLQSFDFDSFAFSEILAHASHLASDRMEVVFDAPPASVDGDAQAGGALSSLSGRPNPFAQETAVSFSLSHGGPVELSILHVDGRRIAVLQQGWLDAGEHRLVWDGTDGRGLPLSSGVYLARLEAGGDSRTWRLVLQR